MSKDEWVRLREIAIENLGENASDEELEEEIVSLYSSQIDATYEALKEEGIWATK